MTKCDKIVIVMNSLSTVNSNTITINVTTNVLIICHSKKVRGGYILYTVLLVIILLLIALRLCCYLIKY